MKKYPDWLLLLPGLLFSAIFGCGSTTPAAAQKSEGQFVVLGPGGGGGVMNPTVSPFDENFVITHCDMTALYVSYNGGAAWNMKNLYNVPEDIEFDPGDAAMVYVATKGFLYSEDRGSGISMLLQSADKGKTWRILYPEVTRARHAEQIQSTTLLPADLIPGALNGTIQKVKVDPADNRRIYLGMTPLVDYMARADKPDTARAMLVRSDDRGGRWKVIAYVPGTRILGIFPDFQAKRVLVCTDRAGILIDEATGKTRELPFPSGRVIAVEGGTDKSETLLYLQAEIRMTNGRMQGGMYLSRDLGLTWTSITSNLAEKTASGKVPKFREGLSVCATSPQTVYISLDNPENHSEGMDIIYSIYKTTNSGKSWSPVMRSSSPGGYLTGNFTGSWMEASYDPGWGGSPIDMGVAPGNPDVCYAGDNGRGYKTLDGGKTWQQVYSHNNADGTYSNTGLNVTTCYGVHFDPYDSLHFFICYTDIGLFHTFDGGKSWRHSVQGVPRDWQNTCYAVAFDPERKDRLWSVWANAHDLPRTKMFSVAGFGSYQGGVARSDDGGNTWMQSNAGLPENAVCTNLLVDPRSPVNARILYVTVFDKGVFKSMDGGKTWNPANKGMGTNRFAWQVREASGKLFVLATRGIDKGKPVDGALYISNNQGETWAAVALPDSVNGPHDLLIDPVNSEIMYLSCWPRLAGRTDKYGGLWKTTDGGTSWNQVFDERIRVNSAGIDAENPRAIYINTFQNAAFKSDDGGTHWKRIEGYRFKWGQRAIPDPWHPGKLYLTTYGGSVFYGPSDGNPGIADDVVNMPDGWW